MEEINTVKNNRKKRKHNERYNNNINSSSPNKLQRSYDNAINRKQCSQNFKSYNITSENNNRKINLQKYNNIRPINQSSQKILGCQNLSQCGSFVCPCAHHCTLHHIHFHHIHIPHNHFCPRLNYSSSFTKDRNRQLNNDLLNEVAELRNECRKFKEELEKTKDENKIENKYIKLLESKISTTKDKEDFNFNDNDDDYSDEDYDDEEENYEKYGKEKKMKKKYHNMLNRSFEVLHSVSNKCDDTKGKMKGGVNYYINKDPEYDELIEAQKKWLDNLPEKINIKKLDTFNYNNNSTYSNTNAIFDRDRFN